jgi:hypothetical protein
VNRFAVTFAGSGVRQAFADDHVDRRIECQANVGTRRFKIQLGVTSDAVSPIDNPVRTRVNRCHQDAVRKFARQAVNEITATVSGVTIWKDGVSVSLFDPPTDEFRRTKYIGVDDLPAERRP